MQLIFSDVTEYFIKDGDKWLSLNCATNSLVGGLSIDDLIRRIKTNETSYNETIAGKDSELFSTKFNIRSNDAMKGMKLVNEKAYDMIHNELSANASFSDELNEYVYKNNDGTVKRNTDGTPMTIEQKAEQIATSDDFSFLIAAPGNAGSGTGQPAEGASGQTEFDKIMASM